MNLKLKITGVYISTRATFVPETKPDKRFRSGLRPTGKKISKTFIELQLDLQRDARLRIAEILIIPSMDLRMMVTRVGIDTLRIKNTSLIIADNFSLSIDSTEYIDVLPFAYAVSESSF